MTTYCCGLGHYGENVWEESKTHYLYCHHPKWKDNIIRGKGRRRLWSSVRPIWCPINIIRFEDVRKVLDAKEKKHVNT
jgi:hypothetical protein